MESTNVEFLEVESRMGVTRDWVVKEVRRFEVSDRQEEYVLRSTAQQDGKVLETDSGDGCTRI